MDNTALLAVVVVAVALVAVAIYFVYRRSQIRARFGPEYERTVRLTGSPTRAESELAARQKRVSRYHIRPLSPEEGTRFTTAWRLLQARFVDDPSGAVNEADRLVTDLMASRGYPMSDFDRRAEDLSVDHPEVVSHYREAHRIAVNQTNSREPASTEDLRQAVVHYRALFDDLLEIGPIQRRQSA